MNYKYRIINATDADTLEKKVNDWVSDGWKPTGGVSIDIRTSFSYYLQAIIKELKNEYDDN